MSATKTIYLDYAAATPVDPKVLQTMKPYYTDDFYNPSALYLAAKHVGSDIQDAREVIAKLLGARPTEVIFTAGGTEADNLAINGIMQQYLDKELVVSAIEHDAIIEVAKDYNHKIAKVSQKAEIDTEDLFKKINDNTVLVSIMYANNEVGTIQPIAKIAQKIEEIRQNRKKNGIDLPLYFHTDASQAPNYLDIHVSRLGVDLMTINGGKIYGPKQSGLLFVKSGIVLKPQIQGGGQERNLRSGTENIPGIMGLAKALEISQDKRANETQRLQKLQEFFETQLTDVIQGVIINGSANKLVNNVHITVPGIDNERVIMELDEQGIMAAVGSACSASNDEPSHVLMAVGLTRAAAQSSIRFTFGRQTTQKDLEYTVKMLSDIVKRSR
jgi:cysteine desulfurase